MTKKGVSLSSLESRVLNLYEFVCPPFPHFHFLVCPLFVFIESEVLRYYFKEDELGFCLLDIGHY